MLALPSLPHWPHMTGAHQNGCLPRAHCPNHIKYHRVAGRGSPGMSPVGCKQKASFRHETADNSLRKQGGLNTDLGGSSEGLLLGKTDELGCHGKGGQGLEPEGASWNIPDTFCPGALVMRLLLSSRGRAISHRDVAVCRHGSDRRIRRSGPSSTA